MTAMATGFDANTHWAFDVTWMVLAIATHAALLGGMPRPPDRSVALTPGDPVDVSFIEEQNEETEPAETEEPEPVEPPPKPKTFKAPKEPATLEEPPAAAQETPIAFDNVILTNDGEGDSSWATEQASGKSVEGPIGSPNAAVTGRSKAGIVGGVIGGTGTGVVVDVGDLSKRPVPPSLKQKLERLYPKKARAEGVEGEAVVRMQIGPDGTPSKLRIISESVTGYELGDACLKALQGEAWQPPIGKDGAPVTTRVTFTCGFEIRY